MTQNQGYENIECFETKVKDYNNPKSEKTVIMYALVDKRTKEVFVGSKKPDMKLERFIKAVGKEPEPKYIDITERL